MLLDGCLLSNSDGFYCIFISPVSFDNVDGRESNASDNKESTRKVSRKRVRCVELLKTKHKKYLKFVIIRESKQKLPKFHGIFHFYMFVKSLILKKCNISKRKFLMWAVKDELMRSEIFKNIKFFLLPWRKIVPKS